MAAFDGDPGVRPSWRAFVAYAAPWEPIPDDGLERFDEAKPRERFDWSSAVATPPRPRGDSAALR